MMVTAASLFSQMLRQVPRGDFARLVRKHGAERAAKGFTCWTQFVAMMFCHLARAGSLRAICFGLACCMGKRVHLGLEGAPNKSTLSYANARRPAALYEELFWTMLGRFRGQTSLGARKTKFRFKNKLLSMDSTTISLCLSLFPWASFRRAKGGIKLHLLLDHDDYMPSFVLLTEARRHDRTAAGHMPINPGSIVAMDKGYVDYRLYGEWCERGIFFVTRLKDNADFDVVEERPVPRNRNIVSDQTIRLTGAKALTNCPHLLRMVVVWDPVKERDIVLLTNNHDLGASTIGAIYKDRWEIELFFKTLKQHLKVKTFVGTTENALRIQIWTALIALLLLRWLHHLSRASWSLSNLAAMVRLNLFTYRDLMQWLEDPIGESPHDPGGGAFEQLVLDFGQC